MAGITSRDTGLEHLKGRASELASAAQSLAALFEQKETCLKREDEAARLKALRSSILERVYREKEMERAAKTGDQMADGAFSLIRLVAGLVTRTFEDRTMQAISRELLAGPSRRETPFGTVLVRVGPRGLPEDVDIVSISELARQSGRDEQAVIHGLLARGGLVLGEKVFSSLIDRLVDQVLKGELSLPVSPEGLWELRESGPPRVSLSSNS